MLQRCSLARRLFLGNYLPRYCRPIPRLPAKAAQGGAISGRCIKAPFPDLDHVDEIDNCRSSNTGLTHAVEAIGEAPPGQDFLPGPKSFIGVRSFLGLAAR
jgi:hypothetical protein